MTAIRPVGLGNLGVELETRTDGTLLVHSTERLEPRPRGLTEEVARWARLAPERIAMARRDRGGGWVELSYGELWRDVQRIAAHLLARRLSPDRPILILSGNDLEHARLALGAMLAGVPIAPISPAYSLLSRDYGRLKSILARLTPGLVFCDDTDRFSTAITATCPDDIEIAATVGTLADRSTTPFSSFLEPPGNNEAVAVAHAAIQPTTVAKVLFTSGSTGHPKGVITTHGMLAANQAMLRHWLAWIRDEPPVLLDWLPWNHTFGGSHNFGLALSNGGTLYIDDGKPTPTGIAETVRNLREISPNIYFNVPKGFEELLTHLRADRGVRESYFRRLRLNFYSGASLPPHIAEELNRLAVATIGARILMATGFGSTETAPASMTNTVETAAPGNIGTPLPGVTLKLLPAGDKLEARIKGPNVTPGYWRDPSLSAAAFDEEGFYRFGDAFRFAEPMNPAKGFLFDGRLAEDFKLATGTWVSVGPLRLRLISALAPLARDVVIAGHDRNEATALVFPDLEACRALVPTTGHHASDAAILTHGNVRAAIAAGLRLLQQESTGSSTSIARVLLLVEPASIDAGEMTDKGSINQRAVLARRANLVEALYAETPRSEVIGAV